VAQIKDCQLDKTELVKFGQLIMNYQPEEWEHEEDRIQKD
jgi:hypothetical protein